MKKPFVSFCLVFFTLLLACRELRSQDLFAGAGGERIQVCTDRTMYISGEKIFFSAVIFNIHDTAANEFSRAFYCELITPRGTRIAGRKYLLKNSSGQGCLTIPEETISGIYFLKFYTRFMRNINTGEYKYILLKIINPFKTEVLPGNDAHDTADHARNSKIVPAADTSLKILTGKTTFSPREEVRLNITESALNGLASGLCLSVVPGSTFDDRVVQPQNSRDTANKVFYFPETRGISISGQVIGKGTGKPVSAARVNLSIIGNKDIMVVRTDSSGRFFFALPDYHDRKDIFLCSDDLPDIKPEILIDNDFCSRPVALPSPPFTLNDEEMKAAYKLAVNSKITSIYTKDTLTVDSTDGQYLTSFYGKPSEVLVMQKYIDLPTLGEYFTDLPGLVKLRKFHGRNQFRFYIEQEEMLLYDPLLLVDWVAVNDIEKVLAMSPLEIERIELVNSIYIKGNISYGGIISFVSKKNDFAGIDLPTSGTFVNYSFLEPCTENKTSDPPSAYIPDSRNTVYWNPDVQTRDGGGAEISFRTPDTPGKYCILLRGIRPTGEIVTREEMIVVKDN